MSIRISLVVAACSAATIGCAAVSNTSNEEQALLARDRAWAHLTATSHNVDSIAAFWTEDARVVEPGQPTIQGKAAIRDMVRSAINMPGFRLSWSPDSAVVSRSGDLAYTYGTNEFTTADSAGKLVTARGRYITVWRKDADGQWRCSQDYSNLAPPGNAPSK